MKPWKPKPADSKQLIHVRTGDQEAPQRRTPYPKLDGSHFLKSMPRLAMHPRFFFRKACQLVLPPAQALASSLGAAPGRGQGWVPRAEHPNLQEDLVFPEVKEPQRVRAQPMGCWRKENPNTPFSTPGPIFSVFVYLPWKRPQGPGRKWANSSRLSWETRSHIVFPARVPHPRPATGAGGQEAAWGPRQEGGVDLSCQRSEPAL